MELLGEEAQSWICCTLYHRDIEPQGVRKMVKCKASKCYSVAPDKKTQKKERGSGAAQSCPVQRIAGHFSIEKKKCDGSKCLQNKSVPTM